MISRKTCEKLRKMSDENLNDFITKRCIKLTKKELKTPTKQLNLFSLEEFREKLLRFRGLGVNKANGIIKIVQEMIKGE